MQINLVNYMINKTMGWYMNKEILVGVISAVGASLITWVATETRGNFSKVELQEIADNIVRNDSFTTVLLNEFSQDDRFKGENGKDGANGRDGIDGKPGISIPNENGTNWCSDFSKGYQICWGYKVLTGSKHFRDFDFSFVSPFSAPPMVTNGINSQSSGYLFSVYNHTISSTKYSGNIAENHSFRKSTTPVTMNYVAIGKK